MQPGMMPPWGMGMPQMGQMGGGGSSYGGYGGGMDPQMVSLDLFVSLFREARIDSFQRSVDSQAAMMAAQAAYQRSSSSFSFFLRAVVFLSC